MERLLIFSKKYGKKEVLFDLEDYELLKQYTWTLSHVGGCFYAKAWLYGSDKPKIIKMHRLVLGFPDYKIDHKDRNGLNNKKSNLRKFEGGQNRMNSSISKNNTTGFKGVTYEQKKKLWLTHIGFKGEKIKGGRFKNKYAAALRYNQLAIKYFGEFAVINKLTEEEQLLAVQKEGRRLSKRNNTGYRGVYKYKDRFSAKIVHNNKKIHIGYYNDPKTAAIAYNEAIIKNNLPKEKMNII